MSKVKFHGIKEDLTAPETPWIYYGVSDLYGVKKCSMLTLLRGRTLEHELRT